MERARRLAWALVGLAFLSKVSLAFTGVVPSSASYFLFQSGIHPYLNVFLNLSLGAALLWQIRNLRLEAPQHVLFTLFAVGTLVILWVQHALQLLTGIEADSLLVLITLSTCTYLIVIFGIVLPRLIPGDEFVRGIGRICLACCALSLLLLFAGFPAMYKGTRFIGIFKHIPYMVTASTTGYLFRLREFDLSASFKRQASWALGQAALLYSMYLTGTRSALFAILIGTCLFFLVYRTGNARFRMARVLGVWLGVVGAVLFGAMIVQHGKDLLTGKAAIGNRTPQDGVGDRLDEVYRGLDMLQKSPHLGLGLLSKFNNADSEEVVSSYNSFQDPHNLFISSAVVAGWPFGVWVLFGYVLVAIACVRTVWWGQGPALFVGLYLLSHLPILAIYHMHLSLGGLADRLYWLTFGYLGIFLAAKKPQSSLQSDASKLSV